MVAKCAYGRPAIPEVKTAIQQRCGIAEDLIISSLGPKHLLFRFFSESSFLKVLLKDFLYIKGLLFRFLKWTPAFQPDAEPSILPVWISFPSLPANLYNESCIRTIAGNVGRILRIDEATLQCTDTSKARACVEVDVLKQLPSKVWVKQGSRGELKD